MNSRHVTGRAGLRDSRPSYNERIPRPTLVKAAFAAAQRRVVGDAGAILYAFAFVSAYAAVVARKNNYGVVGDAEFIQRLHHATHAFIHAVDHRRISRIVMSPGRGLWFELRDQVSLRLMRHVNPIVRQVEKKWAVLFTLDEVHRLVGQKIREVSSLRIRGLGIGAEVEVFSH